MVIRQFCYYRNYVLTEDASDRSIPTIRHVLQQVEHALTGVRFSMAKKEDGLQVFHFLKRVTTHAVNMPSLAVRLRQC